MNDQAAGGNDGAAEELSVRIAASVGAFTRAEWDSFEGTSKATAASAYNPFISYDFLTALEDSGCAAPRSGWRGHHLRLEDGAGRLLGALPCYLKSHSQGEYVFDHGWADAYERAGGRYYPKLQASVPFTPVTGPRLLVAQGREPLAVRLGLASALAAGHRQARRIQCACHLLDGGRRRRARCGRLPAAHRPAVPLRQRGLCEL